VAQVNLGPKVMMRIDQGNLITMPTLTSIMVLPRNSAVKVNHSLGLGYFYVANG